MKTSLKITLGALCAFSLFLVMHENTVAAPAGFQTETAYEELSLPTTFAFAPDGRIFVAEKAGVVKIIKDGSILPTPFITLTDINLHADHGLIGLALDPDFTSSPYVYLAYTYENDPNNIAGPKTGRIIRVLADGDVAGISTVQVLVGSVVGSSAQPSCADFPLGTDCIYSDSSSHSVGGLRFGPDGKLYAALGDGAGFIGVDPNAHNVQDLHKLAGKILRLNTDGTAPVDNPFYDGDPTSNISKVYSYGHRNSYRFNFHPQNGQLFFGEVGWFSYEEINKGVSGANYGWPCHEGFIATPGYNCVLSNITDPIYTYPHTEGVSNSITGGDFILPGVYPATYDGNFVFADFSDGSISLMTLNAEYNYLSDEKILTAVGGPVDILRGPDGFIYFLDIFTGSIKRLIYSTNNDPEAVATSDITSGPLPLQVAFSSEASSDPDGDLLTHSWDFGDGNVSSEVNPIHTYNQSGQFTVTLTVSDSNGGIDTTTLQIWAGTQQPPLNGFIGEFFNNTSLTGDPVHVLNTDGIDYAWGSGSPTAPVLPDLFSASFIGRFNFTDGDHRFLVSADDGVRVYIDGGIIIDAWLDQPYTNYESTVNLTAGEHIVLVEYYENEGMAGLAVRWEKIGESASGPNPVHIASTMAPVSAFVGDLITFTTNIRNTGLEGSFLVNLELHNSANQKVAQRYYDNELLLADEEKQYTLTWQVPSPGIYRLAVGLIEPAWGGLYQWTNEAIIFQANTRSPGPGPDPEPEPEPNPDITIFGDALVFDGNNDYVDVLAWVLQGDQVTLEAIAYPETIKQTYFLVKSDPATSDIMWYLGMEGSGELSFGIRTTSGFTEIAGGNVIANEKLHIAGVYDGSELRLYQNGVLVATGLLTGTVTENSLPVWIGGLPGNPNENAFDGIIDDVRVYQTVLSHTELVDLAASELSGDEPGLIKYWQFNEGWGQRVLDTSLSSYHGILGSALEGDSNDPTWFNGGPENPTGTFNPTHSSTTFIKVGNQYSLTTEVQNTGDGPGYMVVNVEIFDENGTQVFQEFYDEQVFLPENQPGEIKTYQYTWQPESFGLYRVAVGLVRLNWVGVYQWVNEAVFIDHQEIAPEPEPEPEPNPEPDPVRSYVYDDSLASGWRNWSWEATTELENSTNSFLGPNSLLVAFSHEWGGLYLSVDSFDTSGNTQLNFQLHGGTQGGQDLQIFFYDSSYQVIQQKKLEDYLTGPILASLWQQVIIPISDLTDSSGVITGIAIMGADGTILPEFYLDEIFFEQ